MLFCVFEQEVATICGQNFKVESLLVLSVDFFLMFKAKYALD